MNYLSVSKDYIKSLALHVYSADCFMIFMLLTFLTFMSWGFMVYTEYRECVYRSV